MSGANRLKSGIRFVCATAIALCAVCTPARAETLATDAQVAIVTRGEFFKVEDLHFGVVIPGTSAGTVVLAPDGTRTQTGGITLVGNSHHPAEFAGRRILLDNAPVIVSVGSSTVTLTGPGAPMQVTLFRGNTTPGGTFSLIPQLVQVQGQANGAFELTVGATLSVNANQASGTYSGTWSLTLNFL